MRRSGTLAVRSNLRDSYAEFRGNELWLVGLHISPYTQGTAWNHEPLRARKLLLNRHEIDRMAGKVREKGYTITPTRLYFRDGRAKVEIGLARGKRQYDKRHVLAEKDAKRDMARAIRSRRDG